MGDATPLCQFLPPPRAPSFQGGSLPPPRRHVGLFSPLPPLHALSAPLLLPTSFIFVPSASGTWLPTAAPSVPLLLPAKSRHFSQKGKSLAKVNGGRVGAGGGDTALVFRGWRLYLNEEGPLGVALSQSVHLHPLEHLFWSCAGKGCGTHPIYGLPTWRAGSPLHSPGWPFSTVPPP